MNKVSISEVVDKLGVSKYTFKIYFLIGLALIFAGYNYMIVAYTMPQMSQEWALTKIQTGSLSSWSILGLLIGGLSAGVISDKIGRKKAFAIFVLVYSMLTSRFFMYKVLKPLLF